MNDWPQCTYPGKCIFRRGRDCMILNAMPKKRKSGNCPFRKEHPNDIAGKEPAAEPQQKGEMYGEHTETINQDHS